MAKPEVKIFSMPQEFPCGSGSECCGAIGNTEEELQALKQGLERALAVDVQIFNVKEGADMKEHRKILGLLRSFGWGVLPVITIGDEVVSMGLPGVDEAIAAVRAKLQGTAV